MSRMIAAAAQQTPNEAVAGKFLTFFLADEEYGLEILKVREIIGLLPITRVPRTPAFIRGVVNLRGKVIAVVDLRLRLGMERAEQSHRSCIVVVQAAGMEFGVVVDRVSEVTQIASEQIEETPALCADIDDHYLLGIAKSGGQIKLLLDIDRVLTREDLQQVRAAGSGVTAA